VKQLNTECENLNEVVDVRNQPIDAHFHEHDESPTDVLTNFAVLISRQKEKTLHRHETIKRFYNNSDCNYYCCC